MLPSDSELDFHVPRIAPNPPTPAGAKHTHSTSPRIHSMKPRIPSTNLHARLMTLKLRVKNRTRSTKTLQVKKPIPLTKKLNSHWTGLLIARGRELDRQASEWVFPLYLLLQGAPSPERKPFSPRVYWKVGAEGIQEAPLTPHRYPQSIGSDLDCCAHPITRRVLHGVPRRMNRQLPITPSGASKFQCRWGRQETRSGLLGRLWRIHQACPRRKPELEVFRLMMADRNPQSLRSYGSC